MVLIALKCGYMAFMVCNFCFLHVNIRRSLLSSACVSYVHLYFTSRVMKASILQQIQTPDFAFRWDLSGRGEESRTSTELCTLGCLLSVAQGVNWPQNPFGKHPALKRTKEEEEVECCIFRTVVWRCLLSFKKSSRSRGLNLLFRFLTQCLNCKSCCSFSFPGSC